MRFEAQVNMHNELGGYERWNSFSSVDRFDVLSGPLEREPYVPKYVEVNYIEGSNDKKWSSENFLWTKKLEVLIWIIVKFLICIDVIMMVCLLPLSGQ